MIMDKKKHLLITGKIGSGKSTLISKILLLQNEPVYGFFTKKEKPDSFGNSYVYIHAPNQPRKYTKENCVGICTIGGSVGFSNIFDQHAYLLNNIPEGSLVVMDELGTMESGSFSVLSGSFQCWMGICDCQLEDERYSFSERHTKSSECKTLFHRYGKPGLLV